MRSVLKSGACSLVRSLHRFSAAEASKMLLFLMRAQSNQSPPSDPQRAGGKVREYTAELMAAALFLGAWCALRLLVSHDPSRWADVALAVAGLVVGLGTVVHSLRAQHAGQRKVRAEQTRARASKRQMRAAKRRERAQRRA
ncbi:MAG TPA: hypothetical protein VHM25_20085 [Polyangiaceae bacterium]|jgi:hypothetical protein|nr:hypothetical protein [Polyangiaceae bacterium]